MPNESLSQDDREKLAIFAEACRILNAEGIPYVFGGGVALLAYGRTRPIKDADLFLPRRCVIAAMDALTRHGGFHTRDTDATWLYKAIKDGVLVDLIVRNTGEIEVTDETIRRGRQMELAGYVFPVMSPEDLLIRKLQSHVEGRPHLFDALSMLEHPLPAFDWDYFVALSLESNVSKALGGLLWAEGHFERPLAPDPVVCRLTAAIAEPRCPAR